MLYPKVNGKRVTFYDNNKEYLRNLITREVLPTMFSFAFDLLSLYRH